MRTLQFFKLDWIQNVNPIRVTQGFHGQFQNNTAMDFSPELLVAPMDGCTVTGSTGSGQQQYFNINLPINGKAYIQCVHGRPARLGSFKKGEIIGYANPFVNPKTKRREDHWHLAINVNGNWHGLLTYVRRDYALQLVGSPWRNPYHLWSFYNDRALSRYVEVSQPLPVTVVPNPPADNNKPFVPAPEPEPVKEPEIEPLPELNPEETPVTLPVQPESKPADNFKPRSEQVKAVLGFIKNILPTLSAIFTAFGLTADQSTAVISFIAAIISAFGALLLEFDKTLYNQKEKDNV